MLDYQLSDNTETNTEEQTVSAPDSELYCAKCRHLVTYQKSRIMITDQHQHRFMNPHGHFFVIGCFSEAPGCIIVSESSDQWSWFPRYTWQVAACQSCKQHLGWRFSQADDHFFGLILEQLTGQI